MQKLVRRMTRFFVSVDPLSALDRLEQAVTDLGLSYRANAPSIVSQILFPASRVVTNKMTEMFVTNSLEQAIYVGTKFFSVCNECLPVFYTFNIQLVRFLIFPSIVSILE